MQKCIEKCTIIFVQYLFCLAKLSSFQTDGCTLQRFEVIDSNSCKKFINLQKLKVRRNSA